jgi:hypothetical protein
MADEGNSREKIKIRVEQHTFTAGTWCAAWLFTIGFLHLNFLGGRARDPLVAVLSRGAFRAVLTLRGFQPTENQFAVGQASFKACKLQFLSNNLEVDRA